MEEMRLPFAFSFMTWYINTEFLTLLTWFLTLFTVLPFIAVGQHLVLPFNAGKSVVVKIIFKKNAQMLPSARHQLWLVKDRILEFCYFPATPLYRSSYSDTDVSRDIDLIPVIFSVTNRIVLLVSKRFYSSYCRISLLPCGYLQGWLSALQQTADCMWNYFKEK